MKHEKHISIKLCDVSSDFRYLAIPGREIVLVRLMLVREENSVWRRWGSRYFVTFAQSITFESINFVICMIYELNSSRA